MTTASRVIDRISRVTPLGVRFWNEAARATVAEGLDVAVYAPEEPDRPAMAFPNRIGTFVLPRLPGRRDPNAEFGAGDDDFWSRIPRRDYRVQVSHRDDYYIPYSFVLSLPARGLAVSPDAPLASPPVEVMPLFPAAAGRVPAGMAVIRAELCTLVRDDHGELVEAPASWALLEAHIAGQPPARGIADRNGRVVIVLPYPEPRATPARPASPPFPPGQALTDQEWTVRLDAFYTPERTPPEIPDLGRTLRQPPAFLWADSRATWPLPDQTLQYGRELIVRRRPLGDDRGGPAVLVTPAASPL